MRDQHQIELTTEEKGMLGGDQGPAVQRAIEIVVALGTIYGAESLVPVASVQVAGVSYKNLGHAGLEFLCQWAAQGARVRVPTTLNPAGMDLHRWRALGFPESFARQQQAVLDAYASMGIALTCTCTPYLVGSPPECGEHVAWSESSAVSFANSVLGARTNREGGPSALAAAICGRTAAYGLHLDRHRLANYRVDVHCPLEQVSDWGALGYLVGTRVRDGIPCFHLHAPSCSASLRAEGPCLVPNPWASTGDSLIDGLKTLSAAMAATGAVALYHIAGLTPEASVADMLAADAQRLTIDDLAPGYAALNAASGLQVDLVTIGCPHASAHEIAEIAHAMAGRQVRAALWITTAEQTRERVSADVEAIERAGGHVITDTCMLVAPVEQLGFRVMATNSAKMAFYTPSYSRLQVCFGTLQQCIEAACSGVWLGPSPGVAPAPSLSTG
jgi:hypothetical protein